MSFVTIFEMKSSSLDVIQKYVPFSLSISLFVNRPSVVLLVPLLVLWSFSLSLPLSLGVNWLLDPPAVSEYDTYLAEKYGSMWLWSVSECIRKTINPDELVNPSGTRMFAQYLPLLDWNIIDTENQTVYWRIQGTHIPSVPPLRPISFIFVQFWQNSCQIICFQPQIKGCAPSPGKSWIHH